MSNVEILYEGPYETRGREQIAMSVTGKWFARHGGSICGSSLSPWRPTQRPRRPVPTDRIYLGYFVNPPPGTSSYCAPTIEECENGVLGAAGVLRLVPGPHRLRVPLSEGETHALRERRELTRGAAPNHGRGPGTNRL